MPLDPAFAKIVAEALAQVTSHELGPIEDTQRIVDLGLDSITLMELVEALEERFNVTLDDRQISELQTVGDLARMISAKASSPS